MSDSVLDETAAVPARQDDDTSGGSTPRLGSAWPFVLLVALGSHFLHVMASAVLTGAVPTNSFYLKNPADVPFGSLNVWAHWDGVFYTQIAERGYSANSPAFFPLYPLLVRMCGMVLGGPMTAAGLSVAAVVVSLAFMPLGLWFTHELARDLLGRRVARVAVLLLAFFPTSFYLGAAYTESLFVALSAGALWAVRVRRDLALACALAALAAATRNVGVFLVLPLAVQWWRQRGRPGWHGGWLALAPGGLVAYMGYLWVERGDPLAFVHEQAKWGRSAAGLLDAGSRAIGDAGRCLVMLVDPASYQPFGLTRLVMTASGLEALDNLLFLLVAVAALVVAARVLPWELTAYSAMLVFVAVPVGTTSDPLMGMSRYVLVAVPLFIAAASCLRSRWSAGAVVAAGAVTSVPLIALFVNWYFVA